MIKCKWEEVNIIEFLFVGINYVRVYNKVYLFTNTSSKYHSFTGNNKTIL